MLRHLLDAMRAEEVKRMKAAILKCFGLPENVNPKNVDEKTKAKLKAYGRQVGRQGRIMSCYLFYPVLLPVDLLPVLVWSARLSFHFFWN